MLLMVRCELCFAAVLERIYAVIFFEADPEFGLASEAHFKRYFEHLQRGVLQKLRGF